jgi:glycosyl transferase family 25
MWRVGQQIAGEMGVRLFLINLDRSADRLAHMRAQFEGSGLSFERVAGVDGGVMSAESARVFSQRTLRGGAKAWLSGQIGCFLSHQKAWNRIVLGHGEWSAIFEDDNILSADLPAFVTDEQWIPADADIVRLETTGNGVRLGAAAPCRGRSLRRVQSPSWGAGGYLLRREVALWLLHAPERYYLPVDRMLFDTASSGLARALRVYQLSPALCVQDKYFKDRAGRKGFSSLIDGPNFVPAGTSFAHRAIRPFGRFLLGYRETPFA